MCLHRQTIVMQSTSFAQGYGNFGVGKIIKAGIHNVCYNAFDNSGNKATCCIRVQVNAFSNPIGWLTCEDNVQISLDDHCEVTVSADMFLKGWTLPLL